MTPARRPRVTLWLLRLVLLLHAALAIAQPVFAGYYLSGEVDAMDWHVPIGSTLWLLGLPQFLVAVAYWRPGGGPAWPALATVGLSVAELVQLVFGSQQTFAVHVPLGTALVVTVVAMAIWSFSPGARRTRLPEVIR